MDYTDLYASQEEPWEYSRRAAEILRHETIVLELKKLDKNFSRILDVGCGLGQLTRRLRSISEGVYACDASAPAIQKSQSDPRNLGIRFFTGGLPGLPFEKNFFDGIVVADGIHEYVQEKDRLRALEDLRQCLNASGVALFTDYMHPDRFESFVRLIEQRFKILKLVYLNDRPWYQFESWFKAVRHWKPVRLLLSQIWIAKLLRFPAKLMGPRASMHLLIIAKKP